MQLDRVGVQHAVRLGGLGFVVAWLFSPWLQARVPWWLAFVVLAGAELEYVVRARLGARRVAVDPGRRAPGADDADLGWGELVEDAEGVRWVAPPSRPVRARSRRALGAGTVAVSGLLFVLAVRADAHDGWDDLAPAKQERTLRTITEEGARIARRDVRVECDSRYTFTGVESDALGVAFPARALAFLRPSLCRMLHDLLAGETTGDERAGEAIVVLAHEAVHLRGVRDEGETECYALQEGVGLGRRLGLGSTTAARLMRARYTAALAERNVVRAAYALPRSCVSGGSLDLRPGDSVFP